MTATEAVHGTEATTPNGTHIYYQAAPKRLYKVNDVQVPSVTEVLGVIDKSGPLIWWGQGVGVEAVIRLITAGRISKQNGVVLVDTGDGWHDATKDNVVPLLTEYKLSTNHQRDKAGDRGNSVHKALEAWVETGLLPDPAFYPEEEQGYVSGLHFFLSDLKVDKRTKILSEVMVGSAEHGFAGRYDLQVGLAECELFGKKAVKEVFQKGRWIWDLKTAKSIYDTHFIQLEAYEGASVECGYKETVGRAVVRVGADGTYEVQKSRATYQDFLDVKKAYDAVRRVKEAK